MQLEIFKYQSEEESAFNEIRTIEQEDGKILFCASDVAKMLGYSRPNDAINDHCRHTSKHRIPCKSGSYTNSEGAIVEIVKDVPMLFISEGDVYRLIVRSKLPSAERFERWLFDEVVPSIRKKGFYGKIDRRETPNFLIRYQNNLPRIERGYFSVLCELFVTLGPEFSKYGYELPNKGIDGRDLYPDISVGRMFSSYLKKKNHPLEGSHKTYKHTFDDDRPDANARIYPYDLIPDFKRFVLGVWLPEQGPKYFKKKDPLALDYLPKILGVPEESETIKELNKTLKTITQYNPKKKRN
jgi:Prophage antirepressor